MIERIEIVTNVTVEIELVNYWNIEEQLSTMASKMQFATVTCAVAILDSEPITITLFNLLEIFS